MEPRGLLLCSQEQATCPYPEPDKSSPSHFLKIHFTITLSSTPRSSKWPPFSGFSTKTLYAPFLSLICATCSAHLIFLYLITQIIYGEEYRASSPRYSLLHSPVISSLWGLNIYVFKYLFNATLNCAFSVINAKVLENFFVGVEWNFLKIWKVGVWSVKIVLVSCIDTTVCHLLSATKLLVGLSWKLA